MCLPLIALTAYGRVEDKVKILASGFDSHVVKPVDLAELSATIRRLLQRTRLEWVVPICRLEILVLGWRAGDRHAAQTIRALSRPDEELQEFL